MSHKVLQVEINTTGKMSFFHIITTSVETLAPVVHKHLYPGTEEILA
jgi:hypothetical protein